MSNSATSALMPPAPGAAEQASGAMRAASSAVESSPTSPSSQIGARWSRSPLTGGRPTGGRLPDEASRTLSISAALHLVCQAAVAQRLKDRKQKVIDA